ncbi:DNA-binding response OmpR family regulator [Leifsonia sp. AK011]|uniref:response regulator transcription factor n=1 Tax=Leifsonia sp. AK011 TaxID=2723075 RepID=UPI0015C9C33B|nr:response regulator transcription factor [Leifsonia sp. AK011]NYF11429.1 DNA-binding response OmpR family regulator [Leifsonia sp. AK011]
MGSTTSIAARRDVLADRRVLVVEDDPTVREVACNYLKAAGFVVTSAPDGFAALDAVERERPDLIVLDRMLPGIDGAEVCQRIRRTLQVPIIMLTALGSTEDRISGLEVGADDYLTKPFSPRELVLRVKSILRRSVTELTPESAFTLGDFWIDPAARILRKNDQEIALSAREFDLFAFLLKHPRQAFSREQLLKSVWNWDIGDLSTVTVTVRRVREKIEDDPTEPTALVTVWGVGYRLDLAGSDALPR